MLAEQTNELRSEIWKQDFEVHTYEIGPSLYVTPPSICRFLQEAAGNHAAKLDVSAQEIALRNQMWVLSRLSLQMENYPKLHENLHIETWPVSGRSAVRGLRDFILSDAAGLVVGKASTMWLLLDQQSKRPLRLPAWIAEVCGPGLSENIVEPLDIAMFCEIPENSLDLVVRASDIDYNMHVNNVCYLEWALEAVSPQCRLQRKVVHLDMLFMAEGKYGMTVTSECSREFPYEDQYLHKISEKTTGVVLALLRTRWELKDRSAALR